VTVISLLPLPSVPCFFQNNTRKEGLGLLETGNNLVYILSKILVAFIRLGGL